MSLPVGANSSADQNLPSTTMEIFAARGCTSKGLENSKQAFDGVVACNQERSPHDSKITGIGPSIIVTNQGVAVCCHDEYPTLASKERLKLRDQTADKIKTLNFIGSDGKTAAKFVFFNEDFLNEYLGEKKLKILLDIKSHSHDFVGDECKQTAIVLLDIVQKYLTRYCLTEQQKTDALSKIIFNSSNPSVLSAICAEATRRNIYPMLQQNIGYDYSGLGLGAGTRWGCLGRLIQRIFALFIRKKETKQHTGTSVVDKDYVNTSFLSELKKGNRKVMVYGMDSKKIIEKGCDGYVDYNLVDC